MCTIIIYGIGSQKQRELERRIREALKILRGAVRIRWEDQVETFVEKGIDKIPTLGVNENLIHINDIPSIESLRTLLEPYVINQTPELH